MSAEDDRGRLVAGDWDGLTRAEAIRRLIASAEERTIYNPGTWWRRLVALVQAWRAR